MDFKALITNLWGIFWVVLFFGGSIFIHEFGHFIIAKKRGLRVPRFSIGFGPKLFSWVRGETEYCISLLPLGGYVALPQMGEIPVLEGNSTDQMQPLSFMDKFLVAVMGAVFNVILAFVLACLLWLVGLKTPAQDKTTEIGYILPEYRDVVTPAKQAGLQAGDKIIAVDDAPVTTFSEIEKKIILGTQRNSKGEPQVKITYERNGNIHNVYLNLIMMATNPLTKDEIRFSGILSPKQDLIVEQFEAGSVAEKCGLQVGDQLLSMDDVPLYSLMSLREYLKQTKNSEIKLKILRKNEEMGLTCLLKPVPHLRAWLHYGNEENFIDFYDHDGCIELLEAKGETFSAIPQNGHVISCNGVVLKSLEQLNELLNSCTSRTIMLEVKNHKKTLFVIPCDPDNTSVIHEAESINRLGIFFKQPYLLVHETPLQQFKQAIDSTLETLSSLTNKNSDVKMQHLMGAPGIMRLLHKFSTDDFRRLLWFMVLLNINLAILNLLPIPVLDGGHILFACIEKLLRRPLPQKFVIAVQNVFVFLFLGLMAYVIFFDLRRWQGDIESQIERQRFEKLIIPVEKS